MPGGLNKPPAANRPPPRNTAPEEGRGFGGQVEHNGICDFAACGPSVAFYFQFHLVAGLQALAALDDELLVLGLPLPLRPRLLARVFQADDLDLMVAAV